MQADKSVFASYPSGHHHLDQGMLPDSCVSSKANSPIAAILLVITRRAIQANHCHDEVRRLLVVCWEQGSKGWTEKLVQRFSGAGSILSSLSKGSASPGKVKQNSDPASFHSEEVSPDCVRPSLNSGPPLNQPIIIGESQDGDP